LAERGLYMYINTLKWVGLLLFVAAFTTIAAGCGSGNKQNGGGPSSKKEDTWGTRHSLNAEQISEITITPEDKKLTENKQLQEFVQAIGDSRYNRAKLRIRPPDQTFRVVLNNGQIRTFSFWLDNSFLFLDDSDRSGYYTLSPKSIDMLRSFLQNDKIVAEQRQGDFVLRVESVKKVYQAHEKVDIRAMLQYTGPKSEVKIYHAASPFYFDITENQRGISIPFVMTQPLLSTVVKKDTWLEEPYGKAGGYGESDPNKEFIKTFLQQPGFPEGNYTLRVRADFYTKNGEDKVDYDIKASMNITVK
jgi:hypothetical protein